MSCMIWVFHVSLDPTPKLHLLMQYELPALSWCQNASIVEDTFVMLWSTVDMSESHTVEAVNLSSLPLSGYGRPHTDRYFIERNVSCA
jgi:hypothetical protein